MTMPALKEQRVVIIGGSSGIGFAVARCSLAAGAKVFIGSSSRSKVEDALRRLGEDVQGTTVDVKDEKSLMAFFKIVGSFDHLVFTAGDAGPALVPVDLLQVDLASASAIFEVRFWGALRTIKASQPFLSETGSITLTDGVMSRRPRKGLFLAGAASGAIEHLVQGLAVDLAPRRINTVCLGFTLTEDHASRMSEDQIDKATSTQLLKRAGKPEEVAQAYLYSMLGTFTTGQTIITDGGRVLA